MRLALFSLPFLATPAFAEVPEVVADIPPVASLVAQVMGDLGQPVLLLEKGASAHDFQLRPSQAAALSDADLVIWVGPEMTPWLDRALEGTGTGGTILGLLAADGTLRRKFGRTGHPDHEEHGGQEQSAEDDGHEHGHAHDGMDPHAWLDPANAAHWLGLIADALAEKDPENAAIYRENAEAARAELARTEAAVAASLAPHKDARFVVFHDAYGYFTDHFGLTGIDAIAAGDAADPGAEKLAALQAEVKAEGIACIFPEAQHDMALAELMTEGTGARLGRALDPEGADLGGGPETYGAILTGLAAAMDDCLSDR
ncbi:MAG: zinc ABC transporter substrate-binding protein [Paracoccaceae bacterium]